MSPRGKFLIWGHFWTTMPLIALIMWKHRCWSWSSCGRFANSNNWKLPFPPKTMWNYSLMACVVLLDFKHFYSTCLHLDSLVSLGSGLQNWNRPHLAPNWWVPKNDLLVPFPSKIWNAHGCCCHCFSDIFVSIEKKSTDMKLVTLPRSVVFSPKKIGQAMACPHYVRTLMETSLYFNHWCLWYSPVSPLQSALK